MNQTSGDTRCNAPLGNGKRCRKLATKCRDEKHRERRAHGTIGGDAHERSESAVRQSSQDHLSLTFPQPLHDNRPAMEHWLSRGRQHFGLDERRIRRDYNLVRALGELARMLGSELEIKNPYSGRPVGSLVFGGGTALTCTWDIAERYSEDIDLVLRRYPNVKNRDVRAALRGLALGWSNRMAGRVRVEERDSSHIFFTVNLAYQDAVEVDVVAKDLSDPAVSIERRSPVSLIGRIADIETVERHPEIGMPGREMRPDAILLPCLSPISIAMDKLLAQTGLDARGDTRGIALRARDIYDLAAISRRQDIVGAQLERDGQRLLAVSQRWRVDADGATRPEGGFAEVSSFVSGTAHNSILRDAYEQVCEEYVWGQRFDFNEAVADALTLDPGPPLTDIEPGRRSTWT